MAAIIKSLVKGYEETLDYTIDWSLLLGSLGDGTDTISTSAWDGGGLTVESSSNDDTTATAFLSGGVVGTTYTVENTIVTVGGRTVVRSIAIEVIDT